jgi:Zn-dependent oligopeptidase
MNVYFSNKELFEQVKQYLNQEIENPLDQRQLESIYAYMVRNKLPEEDLKEMVNLSTELVSVFNTFRATLDGRQVSENDVRQLLIKSNDLDLRERAWHASKQIGKEVEEKLLTLVRKRNETARQLGYEDGIARIRPRVCV